MKGSTIQSECVLDWIGMDWIKDKDRTIINLLIFDYYRLYEVTLLYVY